MSPRTGLGDRKGAAPCASASPAFTKFSNPAVMSLFGRCLLVALVDADGLLLEAKGLPAVPTATRRVQRCLRSCILRRRVAFEEALRYVISRRNHEGRVLMLLPYPSRPRLAAVLAAASPPPIDELRFTEPRKIRNDPTRARAVFYEPYPSVENSERTFKFLLATARCLSMSSGLPVLKSESKPTGG